MSGGGVHKVVSRTEPKEGKKALNLFLKCELHLINKLVITIDVKGDTLTEDHFITNNAQ